MSTYVYKHAFQGLRYFHMVIVATQILTIAIILIIIFQMLILNEYSLVLLRAQTYLSHLLALVFLSFLIFLFIGWFSSKRSYPIILYAVSLSLVSINIIVSLIYIESYLAAAPLDVVKSYPVMSYVINFGGAAITESLSIVFDALSISSFLLMWIATALLLSQYRHRMGRIKYFLFMSIPLIYYIFPFHSYFGDVFFPLLESSPVSISIIYVLIFSASKQVGAVLFSLSFWTASALVRDNRVSNSLLISSIGMAIVFGSIEITPLQYHVYPAFGLVTEVFMPLGTYLLFVGVFTSAKYISRDAEVRKEFYKSASSQLTLLKSIGVSQMEKELESHVKSVEKHSSLSEKKEEPELGEEDLKEILHDVLNELYYSKGKKEVPKS